VASPLAEPARFNLGNTLYQKKDFGGAAAAYRDALRLLPGDADTRHNLELALRAEEKQKQQRQQQQRQQQSKPSPQPSPSGSQGQPKRDRPPTEQEKEQQRFQDETGMPKERAMQLLDALQQNEKDEQRRLMARRENRKGGKDW
jgi:Ca-activated chloride channel homolog